jgi:uncharacterized membrane protein
MLWLKAFHIVFVVAWFAGLFYLPRLFVYHVDASDAASHERFVVMGATPARHSRTSAGHSRSASASRC